MAIFCEGEIFPDFEIPSCELGISHSSVIGVGVGVLVVPAVVPTEDSTEIVWCSVVCLFGVCSDLFSSSVSDETGNSVLSLLSLMPTVEGGGIGTIISFAP